MSFRKSTDTQKTWVCDSAADDVMKQQDYKTAISLHNHFLDREPENALALYHLGYAYGQLGDHLKEVYYYERATGLGYQTSHFYYNMGMAYGEVNNIEKSIWAFNKAIEIDPQSADNYFGLAMAYYQKGTADKKAEEEFLNAINLDPAYVDARFYLSILYADLGEMQKAGQQLRKILEIDPGNESAIEFLKRIERE